MKKTTYFHLFFVLLLFFAISFTACKKEERSWQSDYSIPLAEISLGLTNILSDSLFSGTDSNFKFVLSRSLFSISADSMIYLPDTISSFMFASIGSGEISPGQTVFVKDDDVYFDLGDVKITDLIIRNGKLNLYAVNPLTQPLLISYKIPMATKNAQSFEFSEKIPASTSGEPYIHSMFIDVSGYSLNLKGENQNQNNRLQTKVQIKLHPEANSSANVAMGQEFMYYTKFDEIEIEYAKGFFGTSQNTLDLDTSKLDFFNKIKEGSIDFENIKMNIIVENGFGADFTFKLNSLQSINNRTTQSIDLQGIDVFQSQNISRAQASGNSNNPIISSIKEISLDDSNIKEFIQNLPDELAYSLQYAINPFGNISGGNDFAYFNSKLDVKIDLEIPMKFSINNLNLVDTMAYKLENLSGIEMCKLYFEIRNEFPLQFSLEMDILNSLDNSVCKILPENIIYPAVPTSTSTHAVVSKFEVYLTSEELDKLLENENLSLKAIVDTYSNEKVQVSENQKLDIKIKADFKINFKL